MKLQKQLFKKLLNNIILNSNKIYKQKMIHKLLMIKFIMINN